MSEISDFIYHMFAQMFSSATFSFPKGKDVVLSGTSINLFDAFSTAINKLEPTSTIHRFHDVSTKSEQVAINFFSANPDKDWVLVVTGTGITLYHNDSDGEVFTSFGKNFDITRSKIIQSISDNDFLQ